MDWNDVLAQLRNPGSEFSLMPFWFWNDALDADEIVRQIADFSAHGVDGFVIHPRVGLPRDCGFMSEKLLAFMDVALGEAARRGMKVILYDEGQYPSGSASGLVVARDPEFQCRCLALADDRRAGEVVASFERDGRTRFVVERKVDSVIRGLHYVGEGPDEETPAMSDLLNPAAVAAFIEIVYDTFATRFGNYFGTTVVGIFTDEPNPLGRVREKNVMPGTRGIVAEVSRLLGYDLTPHLPALWFDDGPGAAKHRADYHRAISLRLGETWYTPLHDWCARRRVALCGHPAEADDIGSQRFFHIPGQDLVWRWVMPGQTSGTEGKESTQAKAAASAMVHADRRRNSNEFCGAYGHGTTFDEVKALAYWCVIRGTNMLIPHAFYYSVRGPRRDERPPQLGPNAKWWADFKPFADACRRLCWINTDSTPVCDVAILTDADHCPWPAAKVCLENQIEFHYLDARLISDERCVVDDASIQIAGQRYTTILCDDWELLMQDEIHERLRPRPTGLQVVDRIKVTRVVPPRWIRPLGHWPMLRVRRLVKSGTRFLLLFNESDGPVSGKCELLAAGSWHWIDCEQGADAGPVIADRRLRRPARFRLELAAFEMKIMAALPTPSDVGE